MAPYIQKLHHYKVDSKSYADSVTLENTILVMKDQIAYLG